MDQELLSQSISKPKCLDPYSELSKSLALSEKSKLIAARIQVSE